MIGPKVLTDKRRFFFHGLNMGYISCTLSANITLTNSCEICFLLIAKLSVRIKPKKIMTDQKYLMNYS